MEEALAEAFRALGPASVSPLLQLLEDSDPKVREIAGDLLGGMPGLGPSHLPILMRAVEAGDGALPPAIGKIGTPEAIRFLVNQLRDHPETHTQTTGALVDLGPRAVPDLVELFRCGEKCSFEVLYAASFVLSEMLDGAATAVPLLQGVATDRTAPLIARRFALRTLGELKKTGRPAVPAILNIMNTESGELRTAAREALLGIGGPGTRDALVESIEMAEPRWRHSVVSQIGALGKDGHEAGPAVERLLVSGTNEDRVEAARTLGLIGHRESEAALVNALADPDDWRVPYAAAQSLARIHATNARAPLRATAANHWYPSVREMAKLSIELLDAKDSAPNALLKPSNGSFEYVFNRHACANKRQFPPAPRHRDLLDVKARPALAKQLSYDWVVGVHLTTGQNVTRRAVPEMGVRVPDGWLVGSDHGEFGGELVLKPDTGSTILILKDNIQALHVWRGGAIIAVAGLSSMSMRGGWLYRIACVPKSSCTATWWKQLPGVPESSWMTTAGDLLVNSGGGSVLIRPDGGMSMAPCHDNDRPKTRAK